MTARPQQPPLNLDQRAMEALGLGFALEAHPEVPQIPIEEFLEQGITPEELMPLLQERHRILALKMPKTLTNPTGDPVRYGWEPEMWKMADRVLADMRRENPSGVLELLILGSWQGGKTTYCACRLVKKLMEKPGAKAVFMQETEDASKERQQKAIWEFFPNELKDLETGRLKRSFNTKVVYKQGDGFSNNQFVIPNVGGRSGEASDGRAFFYRQDVDAMQGDQYDYAWLDELAPLSHVKTMRGRLFRKDGTMIVSFTPLLGYTDTVAEWLQDVVFLNGIPMGYAADRLPDGTTVYEGVGKWADAPLLGKRDPAVKREKFHAEGYNHESEYEQVPRVLRCRNRTRAVVWFHNSENFYGNYAGLAQMLSKASRDEILIQAYGIPTKRFGAVFRFYEANIVSEEARKTLLEKANEYSWYHQMDPAGTGAARNPFMQWWAVAKNGQKICVREWPQPGDYIPGVGDRNGVWAQTGSKADGEQGPAVAWFGFGFEQLADEIKRVEEELAAQCPAYKQSAGGGVPRLPVVERYMDSRAAHSTTMTATAAVTLIQQWENLPPEYRLFFLPSPGDGGDNWKILLQTQLERSPALGGQPKIMVCACCKNTIFALQNWTGQDGDKGACKDPIDTVHYIVSQDPPHVTTRLPGPKSGAGAVTPGWTGYGAPGRR